MYAPKLSITGIRHPVMGMHAVLAAAYGDARGESAMDAASAASPVGGFRRVPPFPDARVVTHDYDPAGAAARRVLMGQVDAEPLNPFPLSPSILSP